MVGGLRSLAKGAKLSAVPPSHLISFPNRANQTPALDSFIVGDTGIFNSFLRGNGLYLIIQDYGESVLGESCKGMQVFLPFPSS